MRTSHQLPQSQVYELLDILSVQQEAATSALAAATQLESQCVFAEYLDSAALFPDECASQLHHAVVQAVTAFIERHLYDNPAVTALAERSWVYGEFVEAELQRDELELTLDHEAIPVQAVEILSRVAALEHSECP